MQFIWLASLPSKFPAGDRRKPTLLPPPGISTLWSVKKVLDDITEAAQDEKWF